MKRRVHNLMRSGYSWLHVFWIYLTVWWHFLYWRMQLHHRQYDTIESTQNTMKRTLLIVRHGQTTWNVDHRLPGQLPGIPLNDTGKQQVSRLAEALTVIPISSIISSPLERARETAEIIGQGRGLQVQLEPELMDTHVGPWAGQRIEDLAKNDPAWKAYVSNPTEAPEGIETFPQVQQRAVNAVNHWLAQESTGQYPVFVAHADVVKLLLAHYTGLAVERAGSLMIDNASVSLVELEEKRAPHVLAIGWSPHPGWLKPPISEIVKGPEPSPEARETGEQKT